MPDWDEWYGPWRNQWWIKRMDECSWQRRLETRKMNMTYCMFASVEIEVRNHIQRYTSDLNSLAAKEKIMESDDVGLWCRTIGRRRWPLYCWTCWSMIMLRSGAFPLPQLGWRNTWVKRSVQKSKRVRKQLISNSTSSSSKESASSNTAED